MSHAVQLTCQVLTNVKIQGKKNIKWGIFLNCLCLYKTLTRRPNNCFPRDDFPTWPPTLLFVMTIPIDCSLIFQLIIRAIINYSL